MSSQPNSNKRLFIAVAVTAVLAIGVTALVVGIGHFCLTYTGITVGRLFATCRIGRQLTALPGCLLILLGLAKIR